MGVCLLCHFLAARRASALMTGQITPALKCACEELTSPRSLPPRLQKAFPSTTCERWRPWLSQVDPPPPKKVSRNACHFRLLLSNLGTIQLLRYLLGMFIMGKAAKKTTKKLSQEASPEEKQELCLFGFEAVIFGWTVLISTAQSNISNFKRESWSPRLS